MESGKSMQCITYPIGGAVSVVSTTGLVSQPAINMARPNITMYFFSIIRRSPVLLEYYLSQL